MPLNIPYTDKVNEQAPTVVLNETHTIGIVGTATYVSGTIRLIQVPQGPGPAVSIPGYTEILAGSPVGTQFLVNYTTGTIAFDPSLDGTLILVASYTGLGSEIAAEDVNELQNPLSTIANQTIVYSWPLPPAVTWTLAPGIVTNAAVAPAAGILLNKLSALSPSIVPVSDGSGFLTSSSVTAIELGYVSGVTSSIQTQLNNKQATGNYITALTGDVTATGPGSSAATVAFVGGSTAANVNTATIAANASTALNTFGTIVRRDGSGNFAASTITLENQSGVVFNDTSFVPNSVTVRAPAGVSTSYILNLPSAQGGVNTFLQNNGAGVLTWASSTASPGGLNTQLQYNNAGSFGGMTGATWNSTNQTVIINSGIGPCLDLNAPTVGITLNSVCGISGASFISTSDGTAANPSHTFASDLTTGIYQTSPGDGVAISIAGQDRFVVDLFNSQTQSYLPVLVSPVITTIDASAVLELQSSTKGFLPPRMTTAQRLAIVLPAAGLLVYDTDLNQWAGWNGGSWSLLG